MSDVPAPATAIRQLGICCIIDDFRQGLVTPEPNDELGRWISAILNDLRRNDNSWRFVLWTTKTGRPKYEAAFGAIDVAIWPPAPPQPRLPIWAALLSRDALRGEQVGRCPEVLFAPAGRVVAALKSLGGGGRAILGNGPLRILKPLFLPILGLALWCLFALTMLAYAVSAMVCYPYRGICRRLTYFAQRRMAARPDIFPPAEPEVSDPPPRDSVRLWVAPSPLCALPTSFPFVLLATDVPIYAAPECFEPGFVLTLNAHLRAKAPHALLIASPHRSVLRSVMREFLGVPERKLRRCPPLPKETIAGAEAGQPALAGRRYIYCPAPHRPEKNLEAFLTAFALLRHQPGNRDLQLILGGLSQPLERHPALLAAVLVHGIDPYVHLLGEQTPADRAATLRNAQAAVLPSLYESSSDAAVEALGHGCPVACAAIAGFEDVTGRLGDACVVFEPRDPRAMARALQNLLANRGAIAKMQAERWAATVRNSATPTGWHGLLDEADLIRQEGPRRLYPVQDEEPYRLSLVLQLPIPGGTWESAREIVEGLALLNRRRRQFDLQFIHHPDQPGLERLTVAANDLACVPRVLAPLPAGEIRRLLPPVLRKADDTPLPGALLALSPGAARLPSPRVLRGRGAGVRGRSEPCEDDIPLPGALPPHPPNPSPPEYRGRGEMTRDDSVAFFAELDREALLDRDALFFLAASFPAKLATVRPYGVMVLDMVPFQLADQLSEGTRTLCQAALRPTLEGAEVLVATSEATRALVREYCMIDEDRVVLAPLGCETYRRLSAIHPAAIPGLERPFLLNITNFSPHKGAATVVRAYALLQRRLGDSCPALVFAGCMTETFAPAPAPPPTGYVGEVRDLIAASGLVPGRDVFCLGLISDEQTAWLYRNCRAVLNAAVTDNGTYCLIEGRYFGRPVVTSDYPAARWLCERFGVPARTFAAGDAAALCEEMHASLSDPILAGDELVREQRRLEGEEFSRERFVERLYDHLLELAKNGRRQRQCESLRLSETQQRAVVRMAAMEEAPCS